MKQYHNSSIAMNIDPELEEAGEQSLRKRQSQEGSQLTLPQDNQHLSSRYQKSVKKFHTPRSLGLGQQQQQQSQQSQSTSFLNGGQSNLAVVGQDNHSNSCVKLKHAQIIFGGDLNRVKYNPSSKTPQATTEAKPSYQWAAFPAQPSDRKQRIKKQKMSRMLSDVPPDIKHRDSVLPTIKKIKKQRLSHADNKN